MSYITIGQIGRAHGVDGSVLVRPFSFDRDRFLELTHVQVNDTFFTKLKVESITTINKKIRIKFIQSNCREDAERLRNLELLIEEEEQIALPEDVYFHHDLVNCSVYDSKQNYIGKVKEIIDSVGNDLLCIVNDEEKEILIPNISKFVRVIDIAKKKINIQEIPGLLNL